MLVAAQFVFTLLLLVWGLFGCGSNNKDPGCCPNGPRGECRPGPCPERTPPPTPLPPGPDVFRFSGSAAELLYDIIHRSGVEPGCEEQDLCEIGLDRLACEREKKSKQSRCEFTLPGDRMASPTAIEASLAYGVLTKEGTLAENCDDKKCRVEAFETRCKEDAREKVIHECAFRKKPAPAGETAPLPSGTGTPRDNPRMNPGGGPRPPGTGGPAMNPPPAR